MISPGDGLALAFDGINGCGKSVLRNMLDAHLQSKNIFPVLYKGTHPNKVDQAKQDILRPFIDLSNPTAMVFISLAQEATAEANILWDKNTTQKITLIDRGPLTTICYNLLTLPHNTSDYGMFENFFSSYLEYKMLGTDKIFVIDTPVEICLKRIKARGDGDTKLFDLGEKSLHMLRNAYLQLAQRYPELITVIENSGDINDTFARLLKEIKSLNYFSEGEI
jgi:thymidylate kinase